MATLTQGKEILDSMKQLAKAAKSFKAIVDQALGHNSAMGLDWSDLANDLPAMAAYLADEANLESVSGADISNVIGSFAAYQTYWGTHGGNIEKFCDPIV